MLCDRREELTAQRTQAVCRLHRLLAELTPGGMRRELTANKAQALLARIRPADDVAAVRVILARRGHVAAAKQLADEAVARTSLTSYAWLLAETLTAQAEVSRLAGANEEAAESLRKALQLYEERHATSLAKRLTIALSSLPA